jgi:hypothetical protein
MRDHLSRTATAFLWDHDPIEVAMLIGGIVMCAFAALVF